MERLPLLLFSGLIAALLNASPAGSQETDIPLHSKIDRVAPWTGMVLWTDHDKVNTDAIALEYRYMPYDEVVNEDGNYDWTIVDRLLDQIASRTHQAVLRFYFVYPGKETTVPGFLKKLSGYSETTGMSEGKKTKFVDWSNTDVEDFTLNFYRRFALRYDLDPRLAYLQTGFGLWGEYHIYSGPRTVGKTFPSKAFQARFVRQLDEVFQQTPWMISVDAADSDYSPFENQRELLQSKFGLFDDSFLCKQHATENAMNWKFFGADRWQESPAGGELNYYSNRDQKLALSAEGPHEQSFEDAASKFHITYMIGNDQPRHQSMDRIKSASTAMGYSLRVSRFQFDGVKYQISISNEGVAPPYHDCFVSVGKTRSAKSLKGLLPGQSIDVEVAGDPAASKLSSGCRSRNPLCRGPAVTSAEQDYGGAQQPPKAHRSPHATTDQKFAWPLIVR